MNIALHGIIKVRESRQDVDMENRDSGKKKGV